MKTENLSTLKIHNLTKEQYERELEAGHIDETAFYLTPDEDVTSVPKLDDNGVLHFVSAEVEGMVSAGDAVLYTEQSLTDEQKAIARKNIGAVCDDILVGDTLLCNTKDTYLHPENTTPYCFRHSYCVPTYDDMNRNDVVVIVKDSNGQDYVTDLQFSVVRDDGFMKIDCIYTADVLSTRITFYIIPYDNYRYQGDDLTMTFPTIGIWELYDRNLSSITIPGFDFGNKKIDTSYLPDIFATKTYVDDRIGRIDSILDEIIHIQNSLIGGESE